MTGLEAWLVSMLTPDNLRDLVGITFLVLWLWSEKLSYNPNTPANGVLQRFSPLIKSIGEKLAPPQVTACIETIMHPTVQTTVATQDTQVHTETVDQVTKPGNG